MKSSEAMNSFAHVFQRRLGLGVGLIGPGAIRNRSYHVTMMSSFQPIDKPSFDKLRSRIVLFKTPNDSPGSAPNLDLTKKFTLHR
jgi:hypothetical protein